MDTTTQTSELARALSSSQAQRSISDAERARAAANQVEPRATGFTQKAALIGALAMVVFSIASIAIASIDPAGADDDYSSYPSKPANGTCHLVLSPLETQCAIDAVLDPYSPLVFTVNDQTISSTTIGGKLRLRTLPATCAPVTARYVVDGIVYTEIVPVGIPPVNPSPCTGGPIPTVVVPTSVPTVIPTSTTVAPTPTPTPKAEPTAVATATPTTKATPTPTATPKKNVLAMTGSSNGALVFAALALIAAGVVALGVRRMTHQRTAEG